MDARERWQALQARLTAARAAADAGDRATALREVSAALEIDKEYLAAQALRDQILSMRHRTTSPSPVAAPVAARVMPAAERVAPIRAAAVPDARHQAGVQPVTLPTAAAPVVTRPAAPVSAAPAARTPAVAPIARVAPAAGALAPTVAEPLPVTVAPIQSPTVFNAPALPPGYAKFEQRAKRRRVDRRIDAARLALDQNRLKAAAAALDEVIELDPNLPELAELTARFDNLRRATATQHRGPWVAAAAVFVGALLAATWLQDSSRILSRQTVTAAPLLEPLTPRVETERFAMVPTRGERDDRERADTMETAAPPRVGYVAVHMPEASAVVPPPPSIVRASAPPLDVPPAVHVPEVLHAALEPVSRAAPINPVAAVEIVPAPSAPVSAPSVMPPDENNLIRQTLQRYRTAYDGLDARSAQAVWPAVNQPALARAFNGLESQSLTFDACDLRVHGEAATAICHGSARYVTKIGNREPHVEPRVWNFTLHKAGADWKIDSARAER